MVRHAWSLLLVTAVAAIYLPAVHAPPIFDDWHTLVQSGDVKGWRVEAGPELETAQSPLAGRPLARWSFVITYQLGDGSFAVHRLANVLLHTINSLLLLALLRDLLCRPPLGWPTWLPGLVALLWACHPLQTEAVMYITQRTELLVATCYLLTLWASLRAMRGGSWKWTAVAIAACAGGMASKEVMVSAPLAVGLLARALAGTDSAQGWLQPLRRHRALLAGLAATWLILVPLIAFAPRSWTVGFDLGVSALDYLRSQAQVIPWYLRLAYWPDPLLIHYEWPIVRTWWPAIPGGTLVVALLAGTGWALVRAPRIGLAGACFFMILAPSSSFVPIITEVAAERRMYLPLAVVLTLSVAAAWRMTAARRALPAVVAVLALLAGVASSVRARQYHHPEQLWRQVVEAYPDSVTGLNNLANLLREQGDWVSAESLYRRAAKSDPSRDVVWANIARARLQAGDYAQALELVDHALKMEPRRRRSHLTRADILAALGRTQEADDALRMVLSLEERDPAVQTRLARSLAGQGRLNEAEPHFRAALQQEPSPTHRANLAALLLLKDRSAEAADLCQSALDEDPDHFAARVTLGQSLARLGRLPEAESHLRQAVTAAPDHAAARLHLGITLGRLGRLDDAIEQLREAVRLDPALPAAHFNLGFALLQKGDRAAAAAALQRVLELQPDHRAARQLLGELDPRPAAGSGEAGVAPKQMPQDALPSPAAGSQPAGEH